MKPWGVNKNQEQIRNLKNPNQPLEEKRSQINDLIFHLKELEKEEETQPKQKEGNNNIWCRDKWNRKQKITKKLN